VTVEPAFDGVVAMNRRFTLSSQSCFSAPSWRAVGSVPWELGVMIMVERPVILCRIDPPGRSVALRQKRDELRLE
jgi:hypothetical protein